MVDRSDQLAASRDNGSVGRRASHQHIPIQSW